MAKQKWLSILLGTAILSFGLYNVHSLSGVTEGGALGLTLLLHHWLGLSPAWSGLIINFTCYAYGLRTLGGRFLVWSAIGGGSLMIELQEPSDLMVIPEKVTPSGVVMGVPTTVFTSSISRIFWMVDSSILGSFWLI